MIEVKNLTKEIKYSTGIFLPIINDISFSIDKKETVGLLGKIGSGKSTIALCMLRLLEPTSGEIYFEGERVDNISQRKFRKYRKEYQIIFQDSSSTLNPVYTIEEQLREVFLYYRLSDIHSVSKKIDSLLEEVGLYPSIKNKYPHEISTGEKQRVCIARVLITNPKFIILDEISSSLDVINERKIFDLLKDIQKKRLVSYLLITHNIKLACSYCDRIMILSDKKLKFLNNSKVSEDELIKHFVD